MICRFRHCIREVPPDLAVRNMLYCRDSCRRAENNARKQGRYKKVLKPFTSIQILCPCGCWNFFWAEKKSPQRKYYKSYPCRHVHYMKLNGTTQNTEQVISSTKDRLDICHKQVMCKGRKIACADYTDCLEEVAKGNDWKCSDGVNRYKDPQTVPVNTLGSSVAYCQSRGFSYTT